MSSFSIGEVAKRAGVGIDTVRYYQRSELLSTGNWRPVRSSVHSRARRTHEHAFAP